MSDTDDLLILGDGPGARETARAAVCRGLRVTSVRPSTASGNEPGVSGWPWPYESDCGELKAGNGSAGRYLEGRACLAGRGAVIVAGAAGPVSLVPRRLVLAPRLRPARPSWWNGPPAFPQRPGAGDPARVVVLGGGQTGVEAAAAWANGRREVLLVEAAVRILPDWEAALSESALAALQAAGVTVLAGWRAVLVEAGNRGCRLVLRAGGGVPDRVEMADLVVPALGWRPALGGCGVERTRAMVDRDGFLQVDSRLATSEPGLHAVGGALALPLTPGTVRRQASMIASLAEGQEPAPVRFGALPRVIVRPLPMLTAGLSAAGAAARGFRAACGRVDEGAAWVRCVVDADTGAPLGVQAVGAGTVALESVVASLLGNAEAGAATGPGDEGGLKPPPLPPLLAAALARAVSDEVRHG